MHVKAVEKPAVKGASAAGAEVSHLRSRFIAKTPPCTGECPCGADIRGWINTISQSEDYGRTYEQVYEIAWNKIVDRNPFPVISGRVCPHPCENACNRIEKDGAAAINALERFVGGFGISKSRSN